MAGVSVGFAKCFMLFMAIVILVQGFAYLGLSLWGIIIHGNCEDTSDIARNPFGFAMDLIYFVHESCGEPTLQLEGQSIQLEMDWAKSFEITNREFIFMVTYAVISGLWIASSVLIIVTLCATTTKLISGIVYWPWFLSVVAGCIVDVAATVYHAIDVSKTVSLGDTFNFVGAKMPDNVPNNVYTLLDTFGVYFSTPAILMLCLSCRVVIIWLLNLIGGIFCLSLSNVLANQAAEKKNATIIQPRQQTPQQFVFAEQVQPQPTAPMSSTQNLAEIEPQYPEQIYPKPLPIIIPAQNAEMLQQQDPRYQPADRTTLQSPVLVLPPPQQSPQYPPQPQTQTQDINTYRTTDAHPDQLNYPAAEPTSPRANSPAAQQLASGSALNSRYSDIYPAQPANPRVSEELRNQMPWSYTSMITKPPPPPRKPQQQVQIYPQIPEPDYIEH